MTEIRTGNDCHIDDPLLLTDKKQLQKNFSPLALINMINAKCKESIGFQEANRKNPDDTNTMLYSYVVVMPSKEISA